MKPQKLRGVEERLEEFVRELTGPMGRKERRHWAGLYARGLMLDGERKSIEPLAGRVKGDVQAMQQFIGQSPWEAERVQELLSRRMEEELSSATYWIVDETSFPKQGEHSVGVSRQYCGALGKVANCQVAVSLHWGSEGASFPLDWRLYLPESWAEDGKRRRAAGIPKAVVYKSKPDLALEMMDQVMGWGIKPGAVLADSGYGNSYEWRDGLRQRELEYAVRVEGATVVWRHMPDGKAPEYRGQGRPPKRANRHQMPEPIPLAALARKLPLKTWRTVAWREGTKGIQRSRFAMVEVVCAHGWRKGSSIPRVKELALIEWPSDEPEPIKFWLGRFATPSVGLRRFVRTAKARWRIEMDYRQLKDELGLDHFEGRGWLGWHHHVTMVTLAYAFLCSEKARFKKNDWCDFASHEADASTHSDPHERTLSVVRNPVLEHFVT
jgi:SRSO17 transposase